MCGGEKLRTFCKMCGFSRNGTYLVLLSLKVGTFLPFWWIRTKKAKYVELRPGVQGAAIVSAAQVRTMCGTSQYVNVLAGSCCRWWMASPNVWLWFFSLVPRVGQLWYIIGTRDGLRYCYGDLRGCLSHVTWRHSVASRDMLQLPWKPNPLFWNRVHLKCTKIEDINTLMNTNGNYYNIIFCFAKLHWTQLV